MIFTRPGLERLLLAARGEPLRAALRDPMNWLLLFVPAAALADHVPGGLPGVWRFLLAVLAIIPLAKIMVDATDHISQRTGPTVGALLNATFGNAPELIISLMALHAGLLVVVKASIVGVILGNLLFVLGLAFFIGGLSHHVQKFNRRGARVQRSVLMIAAISITVPSMFDNFITPEMYAQELALNASVAVVLLATYILTLVFMLKTHPEHFAPKTADTVESAEDLQALPWPASLAVTTLFMASVLLAFMSEILVDAVAETASSLGISQAFIGVIVLALVGGAPESVAAIAMARRNRLDLTMGIAVGSTIQIALFVAPVLVLSSYFLAPRPLDLVMGNAGVMIVLLPVLIFSMIVADGKSNWFKGVQLLSVYLLIALFCFFLPDTRSSEWIKP